MTVVMIIYFVWTHAKSMYLVKLAKRTMKSENVKQKLHF